MMRTCPWCGISFPSKMIGAHQKKFCSAICKNTFHTALRQWAQHVWASGRLSVTDLKTPQSSCTTDTESDAAN